jgi:hypothetical protein
MKNSKGAKSEKWTLASPVIPNLLPENIVNVQVPSDHVKSDVSQRTSALEKKSKHINVIKGVHHMVASTPDVISIPKQLKKKTKAKKLKPSISKTKKRKQKVIKPMKSTKPTFVKKNKKVLKIKPAIQIKTTSAPFTKTKKVTKTQTTTEKNAIDDDFLQPNGGSSGSWDMDHDVANSGSQEVTDSLGRGRFLPGCHCTMFCGRGYDFAGFCGTSSAEFFRPRLSKCCPLRKGSGGRSQQMPFFFDD